MNTIHSHALRWASIILLAAAAALAAEPAAEQGKSATAFASAYVVEADALNLREKPTAASPVVAVLKKGARVEALSPDIVEDNETGDRHETWRRVRAGDKEGWVAARYIVPAATYDAAGPKVYDTAGGAARTAVLIKKRPDDVERTGLMGSTRPTAGYNWDLTLEEDLGAVAANWSFGLDARGEPYLVYICPTYNHKTNVYDHTLTYARRENGEWLKETKDLPSRIADFLELAAAADSRGTLFVALIMNDSRSNYVRDQSRTLVVARRTKGTWSLTDVDRGASDISAPALAVDSRGNPHVAYSRKKTLDDREAASLCYASWTGDRWVSEVVGDAETDWNYFPSPSLALDGRDRPHIAYGNGEAIGYAYRGDGGWELSTYKATDSEKRVTSTSIAVDAAGRPYIAIDAGGDLKVLSKSDAGWETRTVDEAGDVGYGCSILLDGRGYPYISYRSRYDVKFAHWTGDAWYVQTLAYGEFGFFNGGCDLGGETAVALDADGTPHVCFRTAWLQSDKNRCFTGAWRGGAWRLPPGGDPEHILDASSDMKVLPWGPATTALRGGKPGSALTAPEPPGGAWPLYPAPDDSQRRIANLPAGAAVEVSDAASVWETYDDPISEEEDAYAGYFLWYRVRAAGKEGWLRAEAVARPDAWVRFTAPYAPMRERPDGSAPPVKTVEGTDYISAPASKAAIAAGEFYPLDGRCGEWLTANGGWFPAATPGLEFYIRTINFSATEEDGATFTFYYPVNDDVSRIYYSMAGPYFAPYFDDHAILTVTTREGRSYDAVLETRKNLGWHETVCHEGEAVLPEPVKRADIVAVTLTLGEEGERIRGTVDPRPAWAGP